MSSWIDKKSKETCNREKYRERKKVIRIKNRGKWAKKDREGLLTKNINKKGRIGNFISLPKSEWLTSESLVPSIIREKQQRNEEPMAISFPNKPDFLPLSS